jgi:hypothetical protein
MADEFALFAPLANQLTRSQLICRTPANYKKNINIRSLQKNNASKKALGAPKKGMRTKIIQNFL